MKRNILHFKARLCTRRRVALTRTFRLLTDVTAFGAPAMQAVVVARPRKLFRVAPAAHQRKRERESSGATCGGAWAEPHALHISSERFSRGRNEVLGCPHQVTRTADHKKRQRASLAALAPAVRGSASTSIRSRDAATRSHRSSNRIQPTHRSARRTA
jgi:hypothetical protein